MPRNRSVSQVRARFSEYVRVAEKGDPIVITRHGRAVAALIGAQGLREVERLLATAGSEGGLASIAGGWEGSEELVQILTSSEWGC